MSDSTVQITCVKCKNVWSEDVSKLENLTTIVYRDLSSARNRPNVTRYRVHCPKCGTYVIIDIAEEADNA